MNIGYNNTMDISSNIPKLDIKNFRKIYEGDFSYKKEKTNFSEETFEVYRNKEKMTILFISEVISRTVEGILFESRVSFLLSKEYIPTLVTIEKKMGKDHALEIYDYNEKNSSIEYQFINSSSKERREIATPTKFHIATPTSVCSHVFLMSKKFDTTHLNYYQVLKSKNTWNFEEVPEFIEVGARKEVKDPKGLRIGRHNLKCLEYVIFDVLPGETEKGHATKKGLMSYISPFHSIPYKIYDLDETVIEIKTLKNLLSEET